MTQLFANVSLANTFNVWRIRTNQVLDYVNKSANTTGVSNLRSANLVATNITTLSGPVTISGNTTWSAKTKTISGSNTVISSNVTHTSTGAVKLPAGTTPQRGLHSSVGHFRYNTSLGAFEGYTSAGWRVLIANATVTSTYVANTRFQSVLANTNSFMKSQLANTNSYIATKVNTTTFNSALANTNSYIATKVNTTTFNSALANTNSYIASAQTASAQLNSNNVYSSTNQFRIGAPVKTITSNSYSLLAADAGKYMRLSYANTSSNPSSVGITIPTNDTTSIPIGSEYMFIRIGSNSAVIFANSAGVSINSDGGKRRLLYQWRSAVLKKVATNEWDLIGNISL
jgi:hypothetical protein